MVGGHGHSGCTALGEGGDRQERALETRSIQGSARLSTLANDTVIARIEKSLESEAESDDETTSEQPERRRTGTCAKSRTWRIIRQYAQRLQWTITRTSGDVA